MYIMLSIHDNIVDRCQPLNLKQAACIPFTQPDLLFTPSFKKIVVDIKASGMTQCHMVSKGERTMYQYHACVN